MKLGLVIFAVSIAIFLILILCKTNRDNYQVNNESCKNTIGGYCDCKGNVYDCSGVCGGENKPKDNGCCPNVKDLGCGCGDDPTKAISTDPSSNCCVNVEDLGCGCGDDPKIATIPNKCGGCEQGKDCKDDKGNAVSCGKAGDKFPQWADCNANLLACDGTTQQYNDCQPPVCRAKICETDQQDNCDFKTVKCNCVADTSKGPFGANCLAESQSPVTSSYTIYAIYSSKNDNYEISVKPALSKEAKKNQLVFQDNKTIGSLYSDSPINEFYLGIKVNAGIILKEGDTIDI